jgi:UTP:GlnB (protein PII) uridylyltransferase
VKSKSILFAIFLLSTQAMASNSSPRYVSECAKVANAKLKIKASMLEATVVPGSMRVSGIDDRWSNPFKYVWFKAEAETASGEIITIQALTQKSPFKPCF